MSINAFRITAIVVMTVLLFGMVGWVVMWTNPNVIRFRRDLRNHFHPKPDVPMIASLEHELGIAGHEKTCVHCTPRLRLPERYSQGGVIRKPDRKIRLSHEVAPAWGGDLDMIYADECFLSEDAVCVRRDDIHKAARIKVDRMWVCPLHD